MASSSGGNFETGEGGGGHKSVIRALHSKPALPEKQKSGLRHLTTRASWSSLFRFLGPCGSGAESSPERSWYYSARIQRMIDGGELQSENAMARTEAEIKASKVHWSEVVETTTMSETEQSGMTNREYFEVLKRRRYIREGNQIVFEQIPEHEEVRNDCFFNEKWSKDLVVGEKLAEGGQAEIYAATCRLEYPVVVKVFKDGSVLQHLEKQIPPALLMYHQFDYKHGLPLGLVGATLLTDERLKDRFAIIMYRLWGDLRKLIDQQMMHTSLNAGPPFSSKQVLHLMLKIAVDMIKLHVQRPPILHNDLKAANVLVWRDWHEDVPEKNEDGLYDTYVVDYECSEGVVGTGFWRAPEILRQLKDGVSMSDFDLKFSEKCDVYSYGMTCYELVTGRIPFEDYTFGEGRELVLKGDRPELPPGLDPFVEGIITSCWHANPLGRPSFEVIAKKLEEAYQVNFGK